METEKKMLKLLVQVYELAQKNDVEEFKRVRMKLNNLSHNHFGLYQSKEKDLQYYFDDAINGCANIIDSNPFVRKHRHKEIIRVRTAILAIKRLIKKSG